MSIEARILSNSGRRQATIALMIATAMQAFDTTIANVALPQLEQSLGGGIELGSWVMTSYLCASAIMATLTGWLAGVTARGHYSSARSACSSSPLGSVRLRPHLSR